MNSRSLVNLLLKPESVKSFSVEEWQVLMSEAYATFTIGKIAHVIAENNLLSDVPQRVRWQLESMLKVVNAHQKDTLIEVDYINFALKFTDVKPVYLKGAAYILAGDAAANGRIFSDVDIYVPKSHLSIVEQCMKRSGWQMEQLDEHDQVYYRDWMHELPPMTHKSRGTTLDVHHNLLPLTCRYKLNTEVLEQQLDNESQVLSQVDRILHSIVHLFTETEYEKGFRDLHDIFVLLKQYQQQTSQSCATFFERAEQLGVAKLAYYAVRYAQLVFAPVFSKSELQGVEEKYAPSFLVLKTMDWAFLCVFKRPDNLYPSFIGKFSRMLLFVRGHWLKMPLHLLCYHASKKVYKLVLNK